MAKRSRVSGRPGGRVRPAKSGSPRSGSATPGTRPDAEPAATPAPAGSGALTEAEARRAAALEAEIVAQEKAAAAARAAAIAARGRRGRLDDPDLAGQPLSVRAAHEYAYVARDVRRIGLTAGLMLAILISLALAINVFGVIRL